MAFVAAALPVVDDATREAVAELGVATAWPGRALRSVAAAADAGADATGLDTRVGRPPGPAAIGRELRSPTAAAVAGGPV